MSGVISTSMVRRPPPSWYPLCATCTPRLCITSPCAPTKPTEFNQPVLERIFARDIHAAHGWQPGFPPVNLLLTCDTGITSHIALEHARSQGVDVIITDHHELPDELPAALAAINPHLLPAGHPLETLPGVGVAYKLVEALHQAVGIEQASDGFLDLAALGIVADLALQTADTRFILQRGLASLRNPARPGLLAILELAEIDPTNLNEEHIAYELAPRLNALGRLGDANLCVELLTTTDRGQARPLATQLEVLNNRRKLQTDQVFRGALAQIERDPDLASGSAIVLANPAWPAGVIGIVASRLVERFQRPAILIATPEGEAGRAWRVRLKEWISPLSLKATLRCSMVLAVTAWRLDFQSTRFASMSSAGPLTAP